METIAARVSRESTRSSTLLVAHTDVGLRRGLEPGEALAVEDPCTGAAYAATVAGIEYTLTDTVYTLRLADRYRPLPSPRRRSSVAGAGRLGLPEVFNLLTLLHVRDSAESREMALR